MRSISRSQSGNTLVEIIVAVGIFSVIIGSLYSLFASGIELVRDNQARVTALAVANQQIEIIKNLPYDDIGTEGGVPDGTLEQTQTITSNNIPFTVHTDIRFVDDSYDNLTPTDLLAVDYKRVEITVTWPNMSSNTPVNLVTSIVPNGIETDEGGGTLWVEVFDPSLETVQPVSGATVTITATATNPDVSVSAVTDTDGRYILLGAPVGVEAYEVVVTKAGYSTARTYARNSLTNPNPNPANLTVLADQVTTEYFQISELVDNLTVRMQEDSHKVTVCHFSDGDSGNTIGIDASAVDSHRDHGDYLGACEGGYDQTGVPVDTTFTMYGEKTIGTDSEGLPIYKYNEEHETGSDGEYPANNIETDVYHIVYDEETEGYVISGYSDPLPYIALPNTTQTVTFELEDYEPYTLLTTVTNPDGERLTDATVRLYTDSLDYDQTQTAYQYGQVFFDSLSPQTYNVSITLSGYQTYTGTINVSGNEDQTITLSLSS